jgi:hypothetical protein
MGNVIQSVESQPTFWMNTSPTSSGSKFKPSKEAVGNKVASRAASTCVHAGFLLHLFFHPEEESDIFLQNVR